MGQAGPCPSLAPMGGGRRQRHGYNHSKLAEEKHKFLARGGRDKATCMGEPRGGTWAPLLLPREFPLWPQMETWPAAEAQLGSPSSHTLASGSLCSRAEECCEGRRVNGVPVRQWATCEGRQREASWRHFLVPGPQPFQLPPGTSQSSQRPIPCFWKPGPVRFTPSSQDYLFPAPSQSMAVFCDLVVYAQL